jgi:hypothetical protein
MNVGSGEFLMVPRRVAVVPPGVGPGGPADGDAGAPAPAAGDGDTGTRAPARGSSPVAGAAAVLGLALVAMLLFRFSKRTGPKSR